MILDLNNRTAFPLRTDAATAQVWTKPTWAAPFTLRPDLYPTQSTWTTAPEVATAALEYRYGRVVIPGSAAPVTLAKITSRGYFVLIRWSADDGSPIDWLGYAETPVTRDHSPARDGLPETGRQTIRCTGLLRALQQTYIDTTVYVDPATPAQAARSGGTGWTFNAGLSGNRSPNKMQIGGSGPSAYAFGLPRANNEYWSTRDIVEHLAAFHLPTPSGLPISGGLPWSVANLAALPDWDRPVIDSDTRDVASILNDLIQPSRLMAFGIGAIVAGATPPTVPTLTIAPFTTLAAPLVITSGIMPANPLQVAVLGRLDPLTNITADEDATGVVDQVIVQGPREIGIGPFTAKGASAAWEKAWSSTDETKYADGAKDAAGWAALSLTEKRTQNENVRTRGDGVGKMKDVFALFTLKPAWDWTYQGNPIFFRASPADPIYRPSPLAVEFITDELPLFIGIDYSGDPAAVDESLGYDPLPPLWFYDIPGEPLSIYQMFREQPLTRHDRELPFRGWTLIPQFEDGPAMRLVTQDAPQHAIAGENFVGNEADVDQKTVFGNNPPDAWRVVIAVRGDRRPRYAIPAPADVAGLDVVRRKLITFDDDSLLSVHICKDTELGFDSDGELIKSDGGLLRNPIPVLRSLCELLYKQHGQPRYTAQITTGRRLSSLPVGAILTTVDVHPSPINAPITTVRIDCPLTEDARQPGRTTQTIKAQTFQGDVLAILRGQNPRRTLVREKTKREIKPRSARLTAVGRRRVRG